MNIDIFYQEKFEDRHISTRTEDLSSMLQTIGVSSLNELIDKTIPSQIRLKKALTLPKALSEEAYLKKMERVASKNKIFKSYIGQGYYDVIVPKVILRNVFENPGWYTQYTPYQAEIAQGRLQALLNFQTAVIDLTGMEIANASLLDEGTAAAEAMVMQFNTRKNKKATSYFVCENIFPQTLAVLKTRAQPFGIDLIIGNHKDIKLNDSLFGAVVQYPAANGDVNDYSTLAEALKQKEITLSVIADLLSLTILRPPGEWGADVVIGSTQRFGIPMGFGGPHAAYFATKDQYKRNIPGRIIGVSVDASGAYALRMALQTREQHIRRDKASSNICTAQALLAIMASFYAVYHGPQGLKKIAKKIHGLTSLLALNLRKLGYVIENDHYFDTLSINVGALVKKIREEANKHEINLFYVDSKISLSLDETTNVEDIKALVQIFAKAKDHILNEADFANSLKEIISTIPFNLQRESDFLTHTIFNSYHSEHEMLRYIKALEGKDLSLTHSMIPLGSCTMKLNATTEMIPVTWPQFGNLHPFAPAEQTEGYKIVFDELNKWLCEITGFAQMSFQPNSGAQGEYAGLLVIQAYHADKGQSQRNIALIPASAHGTNPASAAMAGMKIVIVKCDERGNIDVDDLKEKAEKYKNELSCLMVTYPSTHGVFEERIMEICDIIHQNGGQVYMDGANMNAQVGFTNPAFVGADLCHLNLHKTFCIPHGGGGPGMGPIGVAKHLVDYLPGHPIVEINNPKSISPVSSAPWGSASILGISHAYIAMMGSEGVSNATKYAILNANYIKSRLERAYSVLYSGTNNTCAHEMIIDCREFKSIGIEVSDIAKRLMDYGFHAPTVSFPVAGTLMIEPTESESKDELDRFCDAMLSIRREISEIENGEADKQNNVLKNAPHTAKAISSDDWSNPYSRKQAAFPLKYVEDNKFWPSVARVNDSYGDRSLVCACPPIEEYQEL